MSAQFDATEEEDEAADGASAGEPEQGSGSPRHESKMRQISQGVEDLTWQNMAKHPSPEPEDEEREVEETAEHEMADEEQQDDQQDAFIIVSPLLRGENPPMAIDSDGDEEHAGEADPAEIPPAAQHDDPTLLENIVTTPPSRTSQTPPESPEKGVSRRASDESMDQEKRLKRKLGDRTISDHKLPEELLAEKDAGKATAAKRPRDDPDDDVNPRETKRPTPPPDKSEKKGVEPSASATAGSSPTASQEQSKASTPVSSQEHTAQASSTAAPKLVRLVLSAIKLMLILAIERLHGIRFDRLAVRHCEGPQYVLVKTFTLGEREFKLEHCAQANHQPFPHPWFGRHI